MNQTRIPNHVVYLVDLEKPLEDMLMVLADHCDEDRMYSPQDVLMLSLHLLSVDHNVGEAIEAMEIDVSTFCNYGNAGYTREQSEYCKKRIHDAIAHYLTEMHRVFQLYRLYSKDGFLDYTFGGWHGPYTPIMIPSTHIEYWPKALSAIVGGEPQDPHPSKIFTHPYPAIAEPDPYLPF